MKNGTDKHINIWYIEVTAHPAASVFTDIKRAGEKLISIDHCLPFSDCLERELAKKPVLIRLPREAARSAISLTKRTYGLNDDNPTFRGVEL